MKISVLGCGRWGAFIAWYLNKTGHDVVSWGREDSQKFIQLKNTGSNGMLTFNSGICLTSDLEYAVAHSDVLIISIGAQSLRSFMEQLCKFNLQRKAIVLCMKGLEESTGKRLSCIVNEFVSDDTSVAVWVGPGHPQDFVLGIPNCMVIDSEDEQLKKCLVDNFSSNLVRLYYGSDMIGSEVGAAAKNVIGIAAGMLDGMDSASLKGALMSRGTREIARLISAMGGKETSAYGLCHLGDYQATLFSEHSHNRRFGEAFIRGEPYNELAEGVATAKALTHLAASYNIDLPIVTAVNNIVNNGHAATVELAELFMRSTKHEF